MCSAEPTRERELRGCAARAYHPHSRTRQLSPPGVRKPDVRPARVFPSPKPFARAHCPSPRLLNALALLLLALAALAVLRRNAPPALRSYVAGASAGGRRHSTVLVDRPKMLVDLPHPRAETVLGTPVKGKRPESNGAAQKGDARHPEGDAENRAQRAAAETSVGRRLGERPQGPGAARAESVAGAGGGSSELGHDARKAGEPHFRDPADFSTFAENTTLNYFHLHKTGGVSFKERLFDFFIRHQKRNRKGQKARVVDTCYKSGSAHPALGTEAQWSCDFGQIKTMPQAERNKIDVVLGHQYWEKGAGYWIPNRDLRYFTVMRHPLHRKVSFFYHFFVRNAGLSEDSVSEKELTQFVLGKKMPSSPLVRDTGPGYYASRLWSDGMLGYGKRHTFIVPYDRAGAMVFNSIRRLRRNFVFIGLQTQEKASLCMLQKTVEAFAKAHGYDNLNGLDEIARQRKRLNTGTYPLSGQILWKRMTEEQKDEFKRVERVDLAIYKESVKIFHEKVKKFNCEAFIVDGEEDNIAV